jgi:hypothetical protein
MSDVLIILLIVLVAVIVLRGPKMLPKLGEALGRTVRDTRREVDGVFHKDGGPGDGTPTA